jgi:hypothetical protein
MTGNEAGGRLSPYDQSKKERKGEEPAIDQ